jgi:hypothetical protein
MDAITCREGRLQWLDTERELRRLLQKGVDYCLHDNLVDAETKHKYYMSGNSTSNINHKATDRICPIQLTTKHVF